MVLVTLKHCDRAFLLTYQFEFVPYGIVSISKYKEHPGGPKLDCHWLNHSQI